MSANYSTGPCQPAQVMPLYVSCIANIKQKARTWGVPGHSFDLEYTRMSSQIRVHGAYGAYNDEEKIWHIEFYMWGRYFGTEPFPFPFPSTTSAILISATNPAPTPTGPRALNSTPIPNPYPPMYIPAAPQTPKIATPSHFSPAPGSGSRANLSQNYKGSSPASGPRPGFTIRGLAANGGSPGFRHMGQAYNHRPTRCRGSDEQRGKENIRSGGTTVYEKVDRSGHASQNGGDFGGGRMYKNGRGAVHAARRQLKIAKRAGGRD
ncbi:uncharacterized protein RAG0_09945 [Rhynchosporium agropyri]|uniref:Uncharacterized protein n=1 Tax=Rhynchosporium agropyri TaxID=914238 RepID=A0A1E1KXU1_9HELO|nr:uncharacterized protein RAG0_09945 [Rhynchosporium agropyri]